ncbi:MAG TPA: hypothetical protein VK043_13935 [Burkholderiales bacterium]|nr:hypothetical protein [Burkholderiales bacterium]
MEQGHPGSISKRDIPSRVEDVTADTRTRLNESMAAVSERARYAMRYADECVHANPWTSVGVGFGVGVIVGALLAMAIGSTQRSYVERVM